MLCNPRDTATHNAGAALDLVCASSSSPVTARVPRCCALSASCRGPRRFCSNLHLNSHLKRWIGPRFWTDCTEVLSTLTAHAPGQRRQPAWWDADCLAACVARNGALRDHRRVRSEESYMRFSAARQQFHRTVRATRRNFWSLWQDHVSSLTAHTPQVAASTIRRSFQCTDSRQAERFQCLTIQTLLQGTIQWHSGGALFVSWCAFRHLV